ncbi:MAG: glycosyltransferase family 2 protein [Chitinophagaceae bacterium]|nr:glycosyltransferase family 2 protein [Chitinophagaceae bacterium]
MIEISCSIVLYNNPVQEVRRAIESVLQSTHSVKVYLVDNSEEDKFRYEFISPQVEYIYTGENLGYGRGHNLAIARVKGRSKYHLILNPDVEFDPAILTSLFNFMEKRTDVGLVMPKVLYRNGELQYLCKRLPSPADLILRRFIPKPIKALFKKSMESYELKQKDYNSVMDIPNLSGCFMFIREEVFRYIGQFDERYFLYLEDTDLCRRINAYYRTIYYPSVSIIHGYSKASYKSLKLMKYHLQSSIKYFNKWGWLFDRSRQLINAAVLDNQLMPALELRRKFRRAEVKATMISSSFAEIGSRIVEQHPAKRKTELFELDHYA